MISSSLLAFIIVYVHHFLYPGVIDEVNHSNTYVKKNNQLITTSSGFKIQ